MIVVRDSKIQGKGIFATKFIPAGTRIIEYIGERISHEEADARYDDDAMDRHHTFLFAVDEHTIVDGAVSGNDSIYINHSCDPNCEPRIERNRIWIYALKDIRKDEELFYDYAYERDQDDDEKMFPCHCGSEKCRKTILAALE